MKYLLTVFMVIASFTKVYAGTAAVRWLETSNQEVRVTAEDLKQTKMPLLGYVYDLRTKQNLCYEGKDFEVIDILYKGFNRHGTETCQSNIFVIGTTINVGPCWMPSVHDEEYQLDIPACQ